MSTSCIFVEREEKKQALLRILGKDVAVVVVPENPVKVEVRDQSTVASGQGFAFSPMPVFIELLRQNLSSQTKNIFLALDSDEKGEYLGWLVHHALLTLSKGKIECQRIHLTGLNEIAVKESLKQAAVLNDNDAVRFYVEKAFHSCLLAHMSRLIGTRSGPGGVPLTVPALSVASFLEGREQEIRTFAGKPKWKISCTLDVQGKEVKALLQEIEDVSADGRIGERKEAEKVGKAIQGCEFVLSSRHERDLEISPPQPYSRLVELVFDAFRFFKMPLAVALQAVKALYDGVEISGKPTGLISSIYPADPEHLGFLLNSLQGFVAKEYGQQNLAASEMVTHGILPLQPEIKPQDLRSLPPAVQKVYELIWQRAVASQMPAAKGTEISLIFASGPYRLKHDSRQIAEAGFLDIYSYGFESLAATDGPLPGEEGQSAAVKGFAADESHGFVSEHYTLPALAIDFAELGVSGWSGFVELSARLHKAGYITLQPDGTLECGNNLYKVINTLNRAFPSMQGLNFIVYYAQTVEEVVSGRKGLVAALRQFDQNLTMQGKVLVQSKDEPAVGVIPKKKSTSVIKGGAPASPRKKKSDPAEPRVEAAAEKVSTEQEVEATLSGPPEAAVQDEAPVAPGEKQESVDQHLVEEVVGKQSDTRGEEITQPADAAGVADKQEEPPTEQPEVGEVNEVVEAGEPDDNGAVFDEAEADLHPAELPEEEADDVPEPETPVVAAEATVGPSMPEGAEVVSKDCPKCGKPMVVKTDSFGSYWACTGLPACRHTEKCQEGDGADVTLCPVCHQSRLSVKKTPAGKEMYVCPRESCEFMAWSQPHPVHCPLCSSPFLVEKKEFNGKTVLRCPKAGCSYTQGLDGKVEPQALTKKKKVVVRRKKGSGAGGGKRKVVVRRRKK